MYLLNRSSIQLAGDPMHGIDEDIKLSLSHSSMGQCEEANVAFSEGRTRTIRGRGSY